ncbi:MAG: hypothetical protein VX884_00940 [Pseudomonadota bacterium]|nr:hypothetical protein [Pseudomonadota bacterium]
MRILILAVAFLVWSAPVQADAVTGTGIICEHPENGKKTVYFFYGGEVHEVYLGQYKIVRIITLTKYTVSELAIDWSLPIRGTTWEYKRSFDRRASVLVKDYINHEPDTENQETTVSHSISYQCQTTDPAGIEELYGPGALDLIFDNLQT